MKAHEFDDLLVAVVRDADHSEMVGVEVTAETRGRPDYHNRITVTFASGATVCVMVRHVRGDGISEHEDYQLPPEVTR
jgi:hypothetical protein